MLCINGDCVVDQNLLDGGGCLEVWDGAKLSQDDGRPSFVDEMDGGDWGRTYMK